MADLGRFLCAFIALCVSRGASADSHWNTLLPNTVGTRITPGSRVEYGVFYTRMIRLEHNGAANGRLIATYEHFPTPFTIFASDDDGHKWHEISTTPRGNMPEPWAFEGEPHLYELPRAVDDLPAGTILIAGSTVRMHADGTHLLQRLEIYYSTDQGLTWKYRGLADKADGVHGAIWEPNIVLAANGNLVMYYSDERLQPKYSQVLAERVSTDCGKTWGEQKNIVAVPDGKQRPGMAIVQRMANGKYVMSYEWINGEFNPAYIRFSDDGINWGDPIERGIPVKSADGATLGGTPYILWVPYGGPKGTLIVGARDLTHSENTDRELFLNFNQGEGPWVPMPAPVQWQGNQEFDGWSMGMIASADGKSLIMMAPSYAGNDVNEILVGRTPILVPEQTYTLQNQTSGLNIGVPGDSKTHGTLLQQLAVTNSPGQIWRLTDLGSAKFGFINPSSGLAIDDYQLKIRNGSPLAVWDSNRQPFQQWKLIPTGDGGFKLRNVNANRMLSVQSKSLAPGASVVLWDDDGTAGNVWQLVPITNHS